MPYCKNCGKAVPEGSGTLCADCAAALGKDSVPSGTEITKKMNRAAKPTPADAPAGLTRRAFRKNFSTGARNCVAAAILGYFSAAVTLIIALTGLLDGSIYMLADVAIVLTLSLLIHLLNSRIASILFLLYGVYNVAYFLVTTGRFSGYLIVIAGILAIIGAFKSAHEWREYQSRPADTAE